MPNPYGRSGAKMREPRKDKLRDQIEDLHHDVYVAQKGREQAERRLKEIARVLGTPDEKPDMDHGGLYPKDYWEVIGRARDAESSVPRVRTFRG